jgi:flagellar M-ring protein FliF
MLDLFDRLVARLRVVWNSMTLNQKVISGAVLIAFFIAIAYLSSFRGLIQNYSVLFAELDAKSASEIITRLKQDKVPYKLSADGSTIQVPKDKATEDRKSVV